MNCAEMLVAIGRTKDQFLKWTNFLDLTDSREPISERHLFQGTSQVFHGNTKLTMSQSWQCWHYCQHCISICLQFSSLFAYFSCHIKRYLPSPILFRPTHRWVSAGRCRYLPSAARASHGTIFRWRMRAPVASCREYRPTFPSHSTKFKTVKKKDLISWQKFSKNKFHMTLCSLPFPLKNLPFFAPPGFWCTGTRAQMWLKQNL